MASETMNPRASWPDFEWLEYSGIDGTGYSSLIGAAAEIVRLVPCVILRRYGGATGVLHFELTVGGRSEGRLMAIDPKRVMGFAEAIVRKRYPQHFRGRPGDPLPGQPAGSSSRTSTGGARLFGGRGSTGMGRSD